MAKVDLGTKRIDPETGKKFYDLNKDPIVSPYTGTAYPRSAFEATVSKARPAAAKAAVVPDDEPEIELEKEAVETVSLEEADDEVAETGAVKVEGEEEIEAEEDDTFLAPEEEEDDNVEDIVGGVEDEEG